MRFTLHREKIIAIRQAAGGHLLVDEQRVWEVMQVTKELKDVMTRYLLGTATSAEQVTLEDRYAAEPQVFEQLVAVENELHDRYARHELTAAERLAFEQHVLAHPRRRARARFAAAFVAELAPRTERKTTFISFKERWANWWRTGYCSSGFSLGMAAAVLCLLVVGWWMWRTPAPTKLAQHVKIAVSPTPMPQLSALPSLTNTPVPHLAASSPTPQSAAPAVVAFTLIGAVVRESGKVQILNIPTGSKQVQLKVNLAGEEYQQYEIQLRTSAGKGIVTQTKLKPAANNKAVTVRIPSQQLPQGDYFLALSGVSDDHQTEELITYFFRVIRK